MDSYQVIEKIGQGGMGVVFRALQTSLQREVALKLLISGPDELQPKELARFGREVRAIARISHPNVIRVLDFGQMDGRPFYAMEYLARAQPLNQVMRAGALSLTKVIAIARQLLDALAALQREGLVHRDLKPGNVMMDAKSHVTLMDFGLVRDLEATPLTRTGAMIGTPRYLSPEALSGKKADGRSDLFALGIILHEALSGRGLFCGDSIGALAVEILNRAAPAVRVARPDCPAWLDAMVAKLLEKDPAARHENATVALAALQAGMGEAFDESLVEASRIVPAPRLGAEEESLPVRQVVGGLEILRRTVSGHEDDADTPTLNPDSPPSPGSMPREMTPGSSAGRPMESTPRGGASEPPTAAASAAPAAPPTAGPPPAPAVTGAITPPAAAPGLASGSQRRTRPSLQAPRPSRKISVPAPPPEPSRVQPWQAAAAGALVTALVLSMVFVLVMRRGAGPVAGPPDAASPAASPVEPIGIAVSEAIEALRPPTRIQEFRHALRPLRGRWHKNPPDPQMLEMRETLRAQLAERAGAVKLEERLHELARVKQAYFTDPRIASERRLATYFALNDLEDLEVYCEAFGIYFKRHARDAMYEGYGQLERPALGSEPAVGIAMKDLMLQKPFQDVPEAGTERWKIRETEVPARFNAGADPEMSDLMRTLGEGPQTNTSYTHAQPLAIPLEHCDALELSGITSDHGPHAIFEIGLSDAPDRWRKVAVVRGNNEAKKRFWHSVDRSLVRGPAVYLQVRYRVLPDVSIAKEYAYLYQLQVHWRLK